MRWLYLLLIQVVFASQTLFAQGLAPSAQRLSGETADQAYLRNLSFYLTSDMAMEIGQTSRNAYSSAVALENLDLKNVPELESEEALMQEFVYIRDTRFVNSSQLPYPRRLSWLYPDDGCFVRADLAGQMAQEAAYKKPAKLFAFGDLSVKTANSPSGSVEWWYHVVIVYKVQGQLYVIDPAIEPQHPITAAQWGEHMGSSPTSKINFAICDGDTYQPYSDCTRPTQNTRSVLIDTQLNYLSSEWYRVQELGRDPEQELGLGDNPPWKKK